MRNFLKLQITIKNKEMESDIIETVGCPLNHDLLKKWENFSLENSPDSDDSESINEETIINQDDLIQQLKNLSFDDISDSKCISSKCSDKITLINYQNKNNSEKLTFKEDKANKEDQSLKNQELLKFVTESDAKSKFSNHLNENYECNFQKKNSKELTLEDSTENDKKEFPSLPQKSYKLLNKSYKSGSDTSTESDSDEEGESVILRERYPKRHNRPENNKQLRTTPFPQNRVKTYQQHVNSDNFEATVNVNPMFCNFNVFHDGHDSLNNINITHFEKYGVTPSTRTFNSCFPSSESVTDAAIESIFSSTVRDQIYNDNIPCRATNQIVSGVIPYTVEDETFDGVVPSGDDRIISDAFAEEIINIHYFNNLKEGLFSESNNTVCISSNVDTKALLDPHFEGLPAEEVAQILKDLPESNTDRPSNQNHDILSEETKPHKLFSKEIENILNDSLRFNQNNNTVSTFKEITFPGCNQHNFGTESNHVHSFFSKENVEETSLYSNLANENNILEKSSESFDNESSMNKFGNYSNLVSKNITSINNECLSPNTSDFINISEEIEHKIVECKEMKEWAMKGEKNLSQLSHPATELSWNMFPFVELDDNSISELSSNNECINTFKCKKTHKKKQSKHKILNQSYKSKCKAEQPKIYWMLGTAARDKLFQSPSFCIRKWELADEEMRQKIEAGTLGTEEKKIIHLKKDRKTKYRGTNLHHAILSANVEEVFCIVENHKKCHGTIFEINFTDSNKMTALDYSKKLELDLLTDYLIENNGAEFSAIKL